MMRYPYLYGEKTRHGKTVWYFRNHRHGPRIRIKGEYGTDEFEVAYRAALLSAPKANPTPLNSSLAWLVARYMETTAWSALSDATRKQRSCIYKQVLETAGQEPYAKVTEATILAGKARRSKTPHQARNFLDAMRGLFRWAREASFIKADPTLGVRNPERKKGDGFVAWTEEHVEAYQARWPLGTRQRVWLDVLLYTGLRRGDAVRLGRPHARSGSIKTEKNGCRGPGDHPARSCRPRLTPGRAATSPSSLARTAGR